MKSAMDSTLCRGNLGQPLDLLLGEGNHNFSYVHGRPPRRRTSPLVFLVYPIVIVL